MVNKPYVPLSFLSSTIPFSHRRHLCSSAIPSHHRQLISISFALDLLHSECMNTNVIVEGEREGELQKRISEREKKKSKL